MLTKTSRGETCSRCASPLIATSAECPSCGKTDLALLRRNLMPLAVQLSVFFFIVFGALAAATAVMYGPEWAQSLAQHIDDQFKPPVTKKK